ncbi:MAG: hypothetical protein QXW98_04725, partial [Candidatus Caldarchaeum sp.]
MRVEYARFNYCARCRRRLGKEFVRCPSCRCRVRSRPFCKRRAALVWRVLRVIDITGYGGLTVSSDLSRAGRRSRLARQ